MVTLLPALLVILGRWVFWPKRPAFGSPEPSSSGFWAMVGRRIAPRARTVWIGTAAVLAVACLGLFALDATGLSSEEQYTQKYDSIVGAGGARRARPRDNSTPIMVVVRRRAGLRGRRGDGGSGGPGRTDRAPRSRAASPWSPHDHDRRRLPGLVRHGARVRDVVHAIPGANALVGGGTAATLLDIETASARDNVVIIPVVLLVVMLILTLLLRALVVAAAPGRDGGALLRRRARHLGTDLPVRLRLRPCRPGVPAVRVRLPGGPRHRLQHLPDVPSARGDPGAGDAARLAGRVSRRPVV